MALSLKYVGARPYAEILINDVRYGFGRGMERDDIPEEFIKEVIMPSIENGGGMWEVVGATDQAAAMMEAIEEPEPEPEPEPESEPEEDPGFSQSMTRSQMMSWCRANGLPTAITDTKASLTAKALAFLDEDESDD